MDNVVALRTQATRLRKLAEDFTDNRQMLTAIMEAVEELELRAQALGNGAGIAR